MPLGPFGGAASIVAADPHTPGAFLAAGNNGLLFHTRDGGASWRPLRFPAQLRGILHALAYHPSLPGTLFAGMAGDGVAGLWRSEDNGESWRAVPDLNGTAVWAIAFSPSKPDLAGVGTETGVFVSSNSGASWRRHSPAGNAELRPVVSLAFDPADPAVLYAGTTHLPWTTRDGGQTWQSIHAGMLDDSDVFSIQVDAADPSKVYATACSGIYASTDGGRQWTKLAGAQGASYRTYFIARHPKKAEALFAGTTTGLVKSVDGGATWKRLSTHTTRSLAFDASDPERMLVATDAGIQFTADGGQTLVEANQGYCNRTLSAMAAGPGALYASTVYDADGGLFRLSRSVQWTLLSRSPGAQSGLLALAPSPADPERLFAAGFDSLFSTEDEGRKWKALALPSVRGTITSVLPFASTLLVGGDGGLFLQERAGAWRFVDLGSPKPVRSLRPLASGVAALTRTAAYVSADGATFSPLSQLPEGADLYDLASAGNGGILAATSRGLLRSEDGGRTWLAGESGIDGTVTALCSHPLRPEAVYAAHYGAVYEVQPGSKTWRRISSANAPIVSIKSLAILPDQPDRLYALTNRQGIFALPLKSLPVEKANRNRLP